MERQIAQAQEAAESTQVMHMLQPTFGSSPLHTVSTF